MSTLRNYVYQVPASGGRGGSVTESLRDAYYRLFTIDRFEDFASTRPSSSNIYHNCESLHNGMHVWCGGPALSRDRQSNAQQGHMSVVAVAAFDPLFWFHHCNIDRTIAIWQALHENSWFDARNDAEAREPLRPFHKDTRGTYWNSHDTRHITELGYTYPILDKQRHIQSGVYQKDAHIRVIKAELTDQYNAARSAAEKAALTPDPVPGGAIQGLGLMRMQKLLAAAPNQDDLVDMTVDDYAVNVVYEKYAPCHPPFSLITKIT